MSTATRVYVGIKSCHICNCIIPRLHVDNICTIRMERRDLSRPRGGKKDLF